MPEGKVFSMTALSDKSMRMRSLFGQYLKGERINRKFSLYDVGDILGVSHATAHTWERGMSFPQGIFMLQKIKVLYPNTSDELKYIINKRGLKLTQKDKDAIDKELLYYEDGVIFNRKNKQTYYSKDKSFDRCKRKFGEYLLRNRLDKGITLTGLGSVLEVQHVTIIRWEDGNSFPQDLKYLQKLDYIFDERVMNVIFGLCLRERIRIPKKEVLSVERAIRKAHKLRNHKTRLNNRYNDFNGIA